MLTPRLLQAQVATFPDGVEDSMLIRLTSTSYWSLQGSQRKAPKGIIERYLSFLRQGENSPRVRQAR
jgi:hypothetical protein